MRTRTVPLRMVPALIVTALLLTACPGGGDDDGGQAGGGNLLQAVKDRGELVCGVNNAVPGFGFVDQQGNFSGFDVDFCRVIAAAVLGDATKVQFRPLNAEQRFTALQANEIDVLIRNTTWTAKRDGSEGAAFAMTTFYDGQGMMVRANSRFQRLEDMNNTDICVLSGTTTELNLESQFRARNLNYRPLTYSDNDQLRDAFQAGRCQGWTSDKSQLAGHRSTWPANQGGPDALRILDATMSKEPLGPVVRDGDDDWFDAVNWAIIATIQAEEFGITSRNVDQIRRTTRDPEIQRFLGVTPPAASPTADATASPTADATASPTGTVQQTAFDAGLDLPADFAYQIVKQVGNYAEIYNRNVGPGTPLGLERGPNDLWTRGGLLYAPPFR